MSYDTETGTFQEYIQHERERLTEAKNFALVVVENAQREISDIDREFAAITAYEAAKLGKTAQPQRTGTKRVRRGSRREALLDLISRSTDGLSRGEILNEWGLKGDKSGEMSVSNALTALTKSGQLDRVSGRYYTNNGAAALREAAE